MEKEMEMILDNIARFVFYKDEKNNLIRVNKFFYECTSNNQGGAGREKLFWYLSKDLAQKDFDEDY